MERDLILGQDTFDLIASGRQNFIVVQDVDIQPGDTLYLHRGFHQRMTAAYMECKASHVLQHELCHGLMKGWAVVSITQPLRHNDNP